MKLTGKHLLDLINQPSLNINGLSSGHTRACATNVIAPTATADLDLRLVVGIDRREQLERVVDDIRLRGYFVVLDYPSVPRSRSRIHWSKALGSLSRGEYGPGTYARELMPCWASSEIPDRKSTRLNSSHLGISYAV